jgi:hypothetical protein
MTAIIYTHPPDYVMAALVARQWIALGVRPVLAIHRSDPRLAVEGVQIIRTGFDRQRNLNGREFIVGHLELMRDLATGPIAIKCDSDTLPLSLDAFLGRGEVALGVSTGQMQGCCYALRVDALPAMIALAGTLPNGAWLPEDRTIGDIARRIGPVHLPRVGRGHTGFSSFQPGKDLAWCRARRISVLNFPLRESMGRQDVVRAMLGFLQPAHT